MAISAKLEMRQSQSLVMTPQLQQAIKLLQLSNLELSDFVESEIEQNPLLERDDTPDGISPNSDKTEGALNTGSDDVSSDAEAVALQQADEWLDAGMAAGDPAGDLDTDYHNIDPDAARHDAPGGQDMTYAANDWASVGGGRGFSDDLPDFEATLCETPNLHDHLTEQLTLSVTDPVQRMIGQHLIDMVDEAGYLRGDLDILAEQFNCPPALIGDTVRTLQSFEPAGVFARDLAECLGLQLRERNRFDPVIATLLDNLDLLASHNFSALRRVCDVEMDELTEMIAEIKELNPKPGLKYGSIDVQPVVPDVIVRSNSDGSWRVELNSETLPKVLVNQSYYATVSKSATRDEDKTYLSDCLQTANWLSKSLDQRARTILKTGQEIVRQQDAFLTHGIQHLRPLNLKTVADAISMHESTISRVTSNKYIATPRGIFELKYFFTSAIASSGNGEAHSSESVRYMIKQLIDSEKPEAVLSDDKIVELLRSDGVDIARRTVAKYREALRIPSSVQRRREKKLAAQVDVI